MFAFSQPSNIIPMPQKSNEWYTPARYIEAARKVMGGIDLDPASCERANRTVKARQYYTKEDNGLILPWYGNVWLNPPFGRTEGYGSNIGLFTEKIIHEYQIKNIQQAILLTTNRLDAPWNKPLWQYPICFADHIVRFQQLYSPPSQPGRNFASHIHGTIFVYFGLHEQKFIDVFSQFGRIAKAIDTPRQTVMPLSLWEDAQ